MGAIGKLNPMPMAVGAVTSRAEEHYAALRSAVGVGGSGPPGGLEDFWRQCKAEWIAQAMLPTEQAAQEVLPYIATDLLPYYEKLLGLPGLGELEERRALAATAYTRLPKAQMPELALALKEIDPAFDTDEIPYEHTTTTRLGKMFPDRGLEATRGVPAFPNFSDDFVLRVTYELPAGATKIPTASRQLAGELLNEVLPAWIDFRILIADEPGDGFRCDGGPDGRSLLGQKRLGW